MQDYQAPWYLRNGLFQSIATTYWYGTTWSWWGERVPWLSHLPLIPWQENIFTGADQVPLRGLWSCPDNAKGTLILNYALTGDVDSGWYSRTLARKAYSNGWAVLIYDWRSNGRSAQLSPVPSSDGWREGEDQLQLAMQLVKMGCPEPVGLVGFSMGGQLALWGLKAAVENNCSLVRFGAVLGPNLESNRSIDYLLSTPIGRLIEKKFTHKLRKISQQRLENFPEAVKPGVVECINSMRSFDQYMVIDYYGFASVDEYYQKTSGLYLLDSLALPYLIIYAADDPIFDPTIIPELEERTSSNPYANLILTAQGGHVAHISTGKGDVDEFWALNRLLEFCDAQLLPANSESR